MGLCQSNQSLLLLVDIQERLAAAMPAEARAMVVRNAGMLARAADLLGIPVLVTEQYPQGLGSTDPGLKAQLPPGVQLIEKTAFSCCGAAGFEDRLRESGRRQIVLAGMEAHVCVLQTALELGAAGWPVFAVGDAVCSRRPENHRNAMDRLSQNGVTVTNTESVLFEWLRDARHEHFKAISRMVR